MSKYWRIVGGGKNLLRKGKNCFRTDQCLDPCTILITLSIAQHVSKFTVNTYTDISGMPRLEHCLAGLEGGAVAAI
jgi:hypothetical protein